MIKHPLKMEKQYSTYIALDIPHFKKHNSSNSISLVCSLGSLLGSLLVYAYAKKKSEGN